MRELAQGHVGVETGYGPGLSAFPAVEQLWSPVNGHPIWWELVFYFTHETEAQRSKRSCSRSRSSAAVEPSHGLGLSDSSFVRACDFPTDAAPRQCMAVLLYSEDRTSPQGGWGAVGQCGLLAGGLFLFALKLGGPSLGVRAGLGLASHKMWC